MRKLGERLVAYAEQMGLSQKSMSQILSQGRGTVSPKSVSAYFAGTRTPTYYGLIAMADRLGVSLDWLTGRADYPMWSPDVLELRLKLRARAPEVTAVNPLERMIRMVRLCGELNPRCRQEWFMAGILGYTQKDYPRFLAGEVISIDISLPRFADFAGLPELWLFLGEAQYLKESEDYRDFLQLLIDMVQLGIPKESLRRNMDAIRLFLLHRGDLTR